MKYAAICCLCVLTCLSKIIISSRLNLICVGLGVDWFLSILTDDSGGGIFSCDSCDRGVDTLVMAGLAKDVVTFLLSPSEVSILNIVDVSSSRILARKTDCFTIDCKRDSPAFDGKVVC